MAQLLLLLPLLVASSPSPPPPPSSSPPPACPRRCRCQNVSPSFTVLCAKTGLLFVPPALDRRTAELRLMDNFIAALRRRDFANMTLLLHLTLSRNAIGQIAPGAFADLRGLRALHLDGNRLTALGDEHLRGLVSLRHLILSNNQLSRVSPRSLDDFVDTIEDLDLSYNNLAEVPWAAVARLSNVNTVSLDHNLIEAVPPGVFSNLHKLARLDMTSNKLKKIPPDPLFSRLPVYARPRGSPPSSLVLSFGGNPLHCNCELVWLRRLAREDDLETCASPAELAGRYFWSIREEEFVCEPPMITHRTPRLAAARGRPASLKCKAVGDPEPEVRWIGPDGRLVANSSRATSYANGTLDIAAAAPADGGTFTCIASNAAGEATAPVELVVTAPEPETEPPTTPPGNGSEGCDKEAEPAASDILTPAKSSFPNESRERPREEEAAAVAVEELAADSALVRWDARLSPPGLRMFQIRYNSSGDDVPVYRMLPPGRQSFRLTDLAPGRSYELCVLAVHADAATALPATRALGCARFATRAEPGPCRSLQAQFLGGTMIIVIGGIIVASVLVFIFLLLLKYKVYNGHGPPKAAKVAHGCSQTNGGAGPEGAAGRGKAGLELDCDKVTSLPPHPHHPHHPPHEAPS